MQKWMLSIGICTLTLLACTTAGKNAGLNIDSQTLRTDKALYTFTADIPQIQGLDNVETQRTVNERLKNSVVQEFRQFVRDVHALDEDTGTGALTKSVFTVAYRIANADEHYLSMMYIMSPSMAGATHPNHFTVTFNYDFLLRKGIRLHELFKDDAYLNILSDMAQEKLIEQSKKDGTYQPEKDALVQRGAGPIEENFSSFTLQPGSLTFYFDPYQVGSYAEGIQQVSFSGALIEEHLSDMGKELLIVKQ